MTKESFEEFYNKIKTEFYKRNYGGVPNLSLDNEVFRGIKLGDLSRIQGKSFAGIAFLMLNEHRIEDDSLPLTVTFAKKRVDNRNEFVYHYDLETMHDLKTLGEEENDKPV